MIDEDWLLSQAGKLVFERGADYHSRGAVKIVSLSAAGVSGEVRGSKLYFAKIGKDGRSASCTCPAFDREGMCKHVVALGLTSNAARRKGGTTVVAEDIIRKYLEPLRAPDLRAMVLAFAVRHPDIRRQMESEIALKSEDDATLQRHLQEAVEDAVHTQDYISYNEVGDWMWTVGEALDRIEAALDAGRAAAVLEPLTSLFDGLDDTLGSIDDSNGEGQAVYARAQELHVRACAMAQSDPVKLAKDLFKREAEDEYDFFRGSANAYAVSLGKRGLAEYRRLVETAWAKVKPPVPRKRGYHAEGWWKDRRLGEMMSAFLDEEDVDGRIVIAARLASSSHDYVELANLCLKADRKADALKWAEEGLFVLDERDRRLVALAARLRRDADDTAGGLGLLWSAFEREPGLELYKEIMTMTPVGQLAAEAKERAIVFLREWPAKKVTRGFWNGSITTLLIEILLMEDRLHEAWEALRANPMEGEIVHRLARLSETELPEMALQTYVRTVERSVGMGGGAYDEAVRQIKKIHALRKRLKQDNEHTEWIETLRLKHKAKRNFIKALKEAGL